MVINISPVSEETHYAKILLYGPPGVGKTTFAGTAQAHPDMSDVLFINIEGGMLSVSGTAALTTQQLTHTDQVEELFWNLANKKEGYESVRTVVLDSGTELQTIDIEGIVAAAREKNKNRSLDDVHLEDYGRSTTRLKRLFRHFRDLPMNVIVTCLVKRVMPANAQKLTNPQPKVVRPALTESLANSLAGYMDCVWYMYEEDGVRSILTQQEGVYLAKTRGHRFSEAIGKVVTEPNLATLYNQLQESEKKS